MESAYIIPVSYTHLDVYKRQLVNNASFTIQETILVSKEKHLN